MDASIKVTEVPARRGVRWLIEAFNLFKQKPLAWIGLCAGWLVVTFGLLLLPLIGGVIANFLQPVFFASFAIAAYKQAAGERITMGELFSGFRRNARGLVNLGLMGWLGIPLSMGTAAISAVGAISQLVIMLVLGLPFAVPIAILSFIACFIPYIGGFVTTGLAFLIAVAYGTPPQIVIMFIYTIVFNLVQGNIVTPLVYTRTVSLHPAIVLLAIPAGGALAGIAGMFLAVPILAVISATWRSVLLVLGDTPASPRLAASLRRDERPRRRFQ